MKNSRRYWRIELHNTSRCLPLIYLPFQKLKKLTFHHYGNTRKITSLLYFNRPTRYPAASIAPKDTRRCCSQQMMPNSTIADMRLTLITVIRLVGSSQIRVYSLLSSFSHFVTFPAITLRGFGWATFVLFSISLCSCVPQDICSIDQPLAVLGSLVPLGSSYPTIRNQALQTAATANNLLAEPQSKGLVIHYSHNGKKPFTIRNVILCHLLYILSLHVLKLSSTFVGLRHYSSSA